MLQYSAEDTLITQRSNTYSPRTTFILFSHCSVASSWLVSEASHIERLYQCRVPLKLSTTSYTAYIPDSLFLSRVNKRVNLNQQIKDAVTPSVLSVVCAEVNLEGEKLLQVEYFLAMGNPEFIRFSECAASSSGWRPVSLSGRGSIPRQPQSCHLSASCLVVDSAVLLFLNFRLLCDTCVGLIESRHI